VVVQEEFQSEDSGTLAGGAKRIERFRGPVIGAGSIESDYCADSERAWRSDFLLKYSSPL
jgi:hypothetical protein